MSDEKDRQIAELTAESKRLRIVCLEGLRLAEIAVRLGLDFDDATTDKILFEHSSLKEIRSVLGVKKLLTTKNDVPSSRERHCADAEEFRGRALETLHSRP